MCIRTPTCDAVTDVLGEPYLAETIELPADDEGEVVATLVRRAAAGPTTKAVLHVHGFADYFFQTAYAEWWTERGYDFYALDLRKYGRSLRPHQTPNYVTDLRDYYAEIDEAWHRVTERDGHTEVVISAHSTGGLVVGLWADDRRPAELAGAVMNSPWLDLQGSALLRVVGTPILKQVGARQPMREIKRHVTGLYTRSLHRDHDGEWDFDLLWKPIESFTVYAGWLRAIREGHARLHRGLDAAAARSSCSPRAAPRSPRRWARTSTAPTSSSTSPRSAGGPRRSARTSPTSPSRAPATTWCCRARSRGRAAYDAISTWMTAWVDPPKRSAALREGPSSSTLRRRAWRATA